MGWPLLRQVLDLYEDYVFLGFVEDPCSTLVSNASTNTMIHRCSDKTSGNKTFGDQTFGDKTSVGKNVRGTKRPGEKTSDRTKRPGDKTSVGTKRPVTERPADKTSVGTKRLRGKRKRPARKNVPFDQWEKLCSNVGK
jgi:hypothetical protein